MSAAPVRVLVVDDHPLVREALRVYLSHQEGTEVVGEARSAGEAVSVSRHLDVDLVLLDIGLPDANGAAAVRFVAQALPAARILVLTGWATPERLHDCLRAGARGFIDKIVGPQAVLDGIERVARGEVVVDPGMAAALLDVSAAELSPRELEVLEAVSNGLTNRQAASRLGSSEHTVKTQLARVMAKLGAADRTQAVAMGLRRGLLR